MRKKKSSQFTVIAAGTRLEGTLRLEGGAQIEGQIDGRVIAQGPVSIGPEGHVVGEVVGDEVAIGGTVEGSVTARGTLHMVKGGRLEGEARYADLQVDRGAVIDGRTAHADADQKQPQDSAPLAEDPASVPAN